MLENRISLIDPPWLCFCQKERTEAVAFPFLRFSIFLQPLNSRPNHSKICHKHKESQLHEIPEVNGQFYCFSKYYRRNSNFPYICLKLRHVIEHPIRIGCLGHLWSHSDSDNDSAVVAMGRTDSTHRRLQHLRAQPTAAIVVGSRPRHWGQKYTQHLFIILATVSV